MCLLLLLLLHSPSDAPAYCQEPGPGQYVTSTCSCSVDGFVQTTFANCAAPGDGEYVTAACVPGTSSSVGSDTVIADIHGETLCAADRECHVSAAPVHQFTSVAKNLNLT